MMHGIAEEEESEVEREGILIRWRSNESKRALFVSAEENLDPTSVLFPSVHSFGMRANNDTCRIALKNSSH